MEGIILFSDDHIYTPNRPEAALFESLRIDLPVLGVHNLDMAARAVKSVASFKALILDWQYSDQKNDEDFSDIAKEVGQLTGVARPATKEDVALTFLKNNDFYSLIYIYSELDIEESYGPLLRQKFGERVKIKRKDENFTIDNISAIKEEILQDIQTWQENNKNLAVPITWSAAINESIQKIFKELASADQNWLKELYDSASKDGVDPELFVVELLQLLLSESVVQNKELMDAILQIGEVPAVPILEANLSVHRKSISKLFSRLFYSELKETTPIMTGDIFKITDTVYGIVITPECDISFIKKTAGCEFELLTFESNSFEEYIKDPQTHNTKRADYAALGKGKKENLQKLFNQDNPRLHFLPSLPILDTESKISCVIDFRVATKRVLASELIKLERSIKLNSPFIQQLRQRYLSHIGRVGTAALPLHVREWNLG